MIKQLIRYFHHNQFVSAIILVGLVWFLFEIRGILMAVFVAFIIMSAHLPFVEFLRRNKLPKSISVLVPYLITGVFILLLILPLVPFFVSQIQQLFLRLPFFIDRAAGIFGLKINASQLNDFLVSEFNTIGKNAFVVTSRVFGGLFSVLTILVVSFYLLANNDRIKKNVTGFFPKDRQQKALETFLLMEEKLGAWLRGQLVLSASIGVITWIGLTLLGVEFALPLALIAGILEVVPTIGPIISAIPAIIVALTVSPTLAFIVAGMYILVQLLENNILVPKIMEKAVGLDPVVIIIGIMIGGNLLGVLGALLSIPFISMLVILFKSLTDS